jgi:hypothetical protein
MSQLKYIAYLIDNLIQLMFDTSISVGNNVLKTLGEEIRLIHCPSKRRRQYYSHKLLEAAFKLRTHHEGRTCIGSAGCKLINFILQTFDYLLVFNLLALIFGDLL